MSAPLPRQIGRYEIEERLGQGGMGQVYLGRDPQTGERAAIKVLSAALAQEEGFLERFQREIEALRKFSHPHIVRLFEDGVDNGAPWFAMEYVPGGTLLDLLRSERRLDWRRAYALAIETCSALKAAHDQGVVHRDLKPSNLLIDPDEHVHLTDFGVAQSYAASQRLTVTGGVIGTAEYMSPEQAAGQRATRQSDLYSLGAVMYAMVTGRTPFTGNSTVEVMHKHRYGLFDRPRAVLPDLPRQVDDTICKLLEKNPDKRYPDAYVLMRHLQQQLDRDSAEGNAPTAAGATSVEASQTSTVIADRQGSMDDRERRIAAARRERLTQSEGPRPVPWTESLWKGPAPLVAALLGCLGLVAWLWPRAPSEERLFQQGVDLMASGPGLNYLQARREAFQPLLERNSASWRDRVAPLLQEIELYELTRPSRPAGQGDPSTNRAGEVSEPARLLRLALLQRRAGDLPQARALLADLRTLLAGDESQKSLRDLVERVSQELAETPELETARAFVTSQLAEIARLEQAGERETAATRRAALTRLYSGWPELEQQLKPAAGVPSAQPTAPSSAP